MVHLSARLAWHDNGWDGCVCQQPHLNSSCIVQENIRERRLDVEEKARAQAERLALAEQGRLLLVRAALVELAMAQQPDMFEGETLPVAFTEEAIVGLRRHGYPFAPLLKLAGLDGLRPSPADPFYAEMQGAPRERLKRRFSALSDEAKQILQSLADTADVNNQQPDVEVTIETRIY